MPTVASQAFPTLASSFVWLSLLHAAWTGLVVAAWVAWLFQALRKTSHRVRHGVLVVSVGLVVVVPIVFAAIQIAATANRSGAASLGGAISSVVRVAAKPELRPYSPAVEAAWEEPSSFSSSWLRILEVIIVRGATFLQASQACGLGLWSLASVVGLIALAFSMKGMSRLMRDSAAAEEHVIAPPRNLAAPST